MSGKIIAASAALLACAALTTSAAQADTTITITSSGTACKVPAPDPVAAPVTPSVAAGQGALKNKNYALASANFKALAEAGDAEGERQYGDFLMQDCTGLQDKAAAATWLVKAADAGNMPAAAQAGLAYMNGDGVAQDDNKAFAYLTKAANGGQGGAMVNLGYFYLSGRGVAKADPYQGMVWSVKGGEQGLPLALSNIAQAYFKGSALPQDNDKAAYYISAAVARSTLAQRARFVTTLNNISRAMSASDLAHESERAKRWSPGPGSLSDVLDDAAKRRDHPN